MQIRPTAFTIGLIIHFSIALFCVYTEFGIDSVRCTIYICRVRSVVIIESDIVVYGFSEMLFGSIVLSVELLSFHILEE